MFGLLITLVIVAVVAGALGFTRLSAGAATIAKVIAGLMLIGIVLIIVLGAMGVAALF